MTTASEIETQAAAWLVKRDDGALPADQQVEFDAWIASDPRARAAYIRLEMAWKRADGLRRLKPLNGDVDENLLSHSPFTPVPMDEYPARVETRSAPTALVVRRAEAPVSEVIEADVVPNRRRTRVLAGLAVAAALVFAVVGASMWLAYERTGWHEYTTDFGGLSRIVLDDGSVINLNTNSTIRVQLTAELRHIVLERGEALFKVAHDKNRPFDVQAGSTIVRAVGTEFSVRVREAEEVGGGGLKDVEVLVKEGRVAIDPPKHAKPRERAEALPASTSTLSAGEAVVINARRVQVQKVAEADVDRKLSWTEGRLWFERQTLKDVVAEFNRYNRRQMVIADPSIENFRIGGSFEATDPESFIAALERTLGVRAFPSPSTDGGDAEVIRLVGTRDTH
jgi:transmembrane sensor